MNGKETRIPFQKLISFCTETLEELGVPNEDARITAEVLARTLYPKDPSGKPLPSGIGHFFGAMRIDAFRPKEQFKQDMDELIQVLKNAPKARGADIVYIHGEKEYEETEKNTRHGIPLNPKVVRDLRNIAKQVGVLDPFQTC